MGGHEPQLLAEFAACSRSVVVELAFRDAAPTTLVAEHVLLVTRSGRGETGAVAGGCHRVAGPATGKGLLSNLEAHRTSLAWVEHDLCRSAGRPRSSALPQPRGGPRGLVLTQVRVGATLDI